MSASLALVKSLQHLLDLGKLHLCLRERVVQTAHCVLLSSVFLLFWFPLFDRLFQLLSHTLDVLTAASQLYEAKYRGGALEVVRVVPELVEVLLVANNWTLARIVTKNGLKSGALQVIVHLREGVFGLLEEVVHYLFAEIPPVGIVVHVQNLFEGGMIDDIAVVVEVHTSLEQESAVGAEQWIGFLHTPAMTSPNLQASYAWEW